MLVFTLILHTAAAAQPLPRAGCSTNADWQTVPGAYLKADTDSQLRNWWTAVSAGQHSSFSNELGKAFGSHVPYECGLTDDSGCIYAGCSGGSINATCSQRYSYILDFEDKGDPAWAFMSQISMVNLHILFKAIDVGVPIIHVPNKN
jgi:hypothetical protein